MVVLYDTANAYSSLSGASAIEAFEAEPALRCMVPYLRRMLALDSAVKPTVSYYGAGRGRGVAATMELPKMDGLGQGKVTSTVIWNVTAKFALKKVREGIKETGLSPGFIDDLTELLEASTALDTFDATEAAQATVGAKLQVAKMVVRIPAARNAAEAAENDSLAEGFRSRGVLVGNIITEDLSVEKRGFTLLGVPHGTEEFKLASLEELVRKVEGEGVMLASMGVSYPAEALELLVTSLSKRLGFAARQSNPTSRAVKALAIADKHMLAVVERICGSAGFQSLTEAAAAAGLAGAAGAAGVASPPGAQAGGKHTLLPHTLSAYAQVIAGLATRHGGVGLQPLAGLSEKGVLHLAVLGAALPLLLARLEKTDEGAAAKALAAEIRSVETSLLPWAVLARAAHKSVVAAVQPLTDAQRALLKELMPVNKAAFVGKKVEVPTLLDVVTTGMEKGQRRLSHAVSEREFLAAYEAYTGTEHRFMLRTGTASGATAWLKPLVNTLTDDLRLSRARMQPHIFRMALRVLLGEEPVAGIGAMLRASEGRCPSCSAALHLPALNDWAITQHLVGCGVGGWWHRIANSFTAAVADCYYDVGVHGVAEKAGLSETSGHRPGDFTSDPIAIPTQFNCGGNERQAVDTTVQYATLSWVKLALTGHQQKGADMAEAAKLIKLNREVLQGKRTGLPPGFRFVPVAMTSRGVRGKQLEQLLEWLAEYGATNRGVLSYLGEEAVQVKAMLIYRWRQRLSVAIHRSTMEAVWARVQVIVTAFEASRGREALTGADLRFSGARGGR